LYLVLARRSHPLSRKDLESLAETLYETRLPQFVAESGATPLTAAGEPRRVLTGTDWVAERLRIARQVAYFTDLPKKYVDWVTGLILPTDVGPKSIFEHLNDSRCITDCLLAKLQKSERQLARMKKPRLMPPKLSVRDKAWRALITLEIARWLRLADALEASHLEQSGGRTTLFGKIGVLPLEAGYGKRGMKPGYAQFLVTYADEGDYSPRSGFSVRRIANPESLWSIVRRARIKLVLRAQEKALGETSSLKARLNSDLVGRGHELALREVLVNALPPDKVSEFVGRLPKPEPAFVKTRKPRRPLR
jgi:hypothetical protein